MTGMNDGDRDMTDDDLLAPYFAAARATGSEVSGALTARILRDARAAQAPRWRWRDLWQALGGRLGAAGAAAAAVAGLWVGIAPPAPMAGLVAALTWDAGPVDLWPGVDDMMAEG